MAQISQLIKKLRSDTLHTKVQVVDKESNLSSFEINKWMNYCVATPPNVFITLECASNFQCVRSFYSKDCHFRLDGFNDQIGKSHSNHKHFFQLYILSIIELCSNAKNQQIDFSNYYFSCQRAIKNKDEGYELVKVVTMPFSFTSEGNVLSFISWYVPIKEYGGEPFLSDVSCTRRREESMFDRIEHSFQGQKKELIDYLQFTSRQKNVLRLMASGNSKDNVAEKMVISKRTVEKYNQQILSKGHDLFPLNRFVNALDVAEYLKEMGIL